MKLAKKNNPIKTSMISAGFCLCSGCTVSCSGCALSCYGYCKGGCAGCVHQTHA